MSGKTRNGREFNAYVPLHVEVDYKGLVARAWDTAQAHWDADEEERRQARSNMHPTTMTKAPPVGAPSLEPTVAISAPVDAASIRSGTPSVDTMSIDTASVYTTSSHAATHTGVISAAPQLSHQSKYSRSCSCPELCESDLTDSSSGFSSDAESVSRAGSRKRRREGWTEARREKEKARSKAKKEKKKAEGRLPRRRTSESQRQKKKLKRAESRREKEEKAEADNEAGPWPSEYRLPKHALEKWGTPITVTTNVEMENASVAEGAYVGKNRPIDRKYGTDDYTVEGALAMGCRLEEWDGV